MHTFTLGTTKRGIGIQTGFSRVVKPGESKLLLLFLNYRGVLPYYSAIPADRAKAAMHRRSTPIGEDVAGGISG